MYDMYELPTTKACTVPFGIDALPKKRGEIEAVEISKPEYFAVTQSKRPTEVRRQLSIT